MLVGSHHQLPPPKSTNQHQQTGLRQMKIRQHRPSPAELKSRPNKQIRAPSPAQIQTLHRANGGCAYANHPPSLADLSSVLFRDVKSLGMQRLPPYGLKCPQTHMQRDVCDGSPRLTALLQNLGREV